MSTRKSTAYPVNLQDSTAQMFNHDHDVALNQAGDVSFAQLPRFVAAAATAAVAAVPPSLHGDAVGAACGLRGAGVSPRVAWVESVESIGILSQLLVDWILDQGHR